MFTNSQAQALVVTVNSQDWEVTTFTGSYASSSSKFETAANGGVMPWWGSSTNAQAFATAVGSGLGLPNFSAYGPFFGFAPPSGSATLLPGNAFSFDPHNGPTLFRIQNVTTVRTWAQATLVPAGGPANADVPGPLPALGLAVAFGFSRQLRKRIKASSNSNIAGA